MIIAEVLYYEQMVYFTEDAKSGQDVGCRMQNADNGKSG